MRNPLPPILSAAATVAIASTLVGCAARATGPESFAPADPCVERASQPFHDGLDRRRVDANDRAALRDIGFGTSLGNTIEAALDSGRTLPIDELYTHPAAQVAECRLRGAMVANDLETAAAVVGIAGAYGLPIDLDAETYDRLTVAVTDGPLSAQEAGRLASGLLRYLPSDPEAASFLGRQVHYQAPDLDLGERVRARVTANLDAGARADTAAPGDTAAFEDLFYSPYTFEPVQGIADCESKALRSLDEQIHKARNYKYFVEFNLPERHPERVAFDRELDKLRPISDLAGLHCSGRPVTSR